MSWTGLAAGIESGLRSYERVKRIQANDKRDKAESDRLDRETRDREVLDDINKTMASTLGGDMEAAPTAEQPSAAAQQGTLRSMIGVQPEPQQTAAPQQQGTLRARLGGEPAAAPQGQGMSVAPAQQRGPASLKDAAAPKAPPRERQMVDAYRKGWTRAFELGRPDLGMQYFQKEAEMREALTKQALDRADRQFAVTQDPRVYIAPYNDLAPDGVRIEGMTPVLTNDGAQAWKVVSRMPDMPEPVEQVIPGDQLGMLVQQLHDPATVRKAMLDVAQKERESIIKREEKRYESELRLNTEGQLIDRRTAGNLRVVGAQGAQSRATAAYKDKLPNGGSAGGSGARDPATVATLKYMVSAGIAKDDRAAWDKFKTLSAKPEETVVMDLYRANMQSYTYANDPKKAMDDARAVAAQIKDSEGGGGGGSDPLNLEGGDPLGLFQ
jgi:hypothetical protein